jgi:microcystin-dependent protein
MADNGVISFVERSTEPESPSSGKVSIYADTNGNLHSKNSSGSTIMINSTPSGVVNMYCGSSAPTGWLLCKGQAVSRTTYADLFTAIGTTYGAGDGSTTFNLPDLQGKVPAGVSDSDGDFDLADTGGAKTHTLITDEMPSHSHVSNFYGWYSNGNGSLDTFFNPGSTYGVSTWGSGNSTGNTGGGGAHNNLQPYIALNYIIKT